MDDIKKVSVVMCTYNGEKYLKEQLDSIVNQTYPIYELIIQDDCSTDGTLAIIQTFIKEYSYIHLFENRINIGVHSNFGNAFYKATGDYIAVSDQDDIWVLNKLEQLVSCIDCCDMVISNSELFGNKMNTHIFSKSPNVSSVSILLRNCVVGHTALFRKDLLPKSQLIWDNGIISYDALLGFFVSSKGTTYYLDHALTFWRRHENCVSGRNVAVRKRNSGIWGYYYVFCSLINIRQSKIVSKYFTVLKPIFEQNKQLYPIVLYLSNPSLRNLIKCGLYCVRFKDELEPDVTNSLHKWIRAFSLPFFRYRDVVFC